MENNTKLKGILYYYKGVRGYAVLFFVFLILYNMLVLFFPKLLGTVADIIFVNGTVNQIIYRGILIGIYLVAFFGIHTLTVYFGSVATDHYAKNIRQELFEKLQRAPTEKINELGSGRLMPMIMNDTNWIKNYVRRMLNLTVRFPISILGSFIMIFSLNPVYALFAMCCVPIFIVFFYFNVRKLKPHIVNTIRCYDEMHFNVKEGIIGAKEIRICNKAKDRREEFSKIAAVYRRQQVNTEKGFYLSDSFHFVLFTFITAAVIIYGVSSGNIKASVNLITLTVCIQYLDDIREALKEIFRWFFDYLPRYSLSKDRLNNSIYSLPSERISSGIAAEPNSSGSAKLEFVEASYKYRNGMYGLNGINITVEEGMRVAIAGGIGSGKNIFPHLLLKYFKLASGKILVGGMEIDAINNTYLRKNILSICNPNPEFMPGTIRENLKVLNPDITDEELLRVFKELGMISFMAKFDDFLGYQINENNTLSDSAKNVLNIVRTLVKPASIYLFNQCFDHVKQDTIVKLMQKLKKEKRTCLFISYQSVICKNCNKIYVMKAGKVSGIGTHEELKGNNVIYKDFNIVADVGQIATEEAPIEKKIEGFQEEVKNISSSIAISETLSIASSGGENE